MTESATVRPVTVDRAGIVGSGRVFGLEVDQLHGVHDNLEESKELEQGHGPALRERETTRREWVSDIRWNPSHSDRERDSQCSA